MAKQITFPARSVFDVETLCVAFLAEVDGSIVKCRISTEALEDYFGARGSNDAMLQAFGSYRHRIEEVAREMLEAGQTEILITTDDLRQAR